MATAKNSPHGCLRAGLYVPFWNRVRVLLGWYWLSQNDSVPMRFLAKQKFFFDLGQGFMQVATPLIALIAAIPTIQKWIPVSAAWIMVIVGGGGLFSVWLLGWLLNEFKFQRHYQDQLNANNQMLQKAAEK